MYILGVCDAVSAGMEHSMISRDCGWEHSQGQFLGPHKSSRGVAVVDDIYQKVMVPVNLGHFTVTIIRPNTLNSISLNPMEALRKLQLFFNGWNDFRGNLNSPSFNFSELLYKTKFNSPDMAQYAHSVLGFIINSTIFPSLSNPTDDERRFFLKVTSSMITMDVLHKRIKARMRDPNGHINPNFQVFIYIIYE